MQSTEMEPIVVQLDSKWCARSIATLTTECLTYYQPPFCPQGVLRAFEKR